PSGDEVKTPGETMSLECTATGFDINSYFMDWIRQEPGKGLQWLVSYHTPTHHFYSPDIQERLAASKSGSNFYLKMDHLKEKDTATYYCTRNTVKQIKQKTLMVSNFENMTLKGAVNNH
uniref:Ig-like domain-containing protein n=1 Tax=Naja naja TaxID=35670 RepID=A0A8C6X674_NAJNA